MLDKNKLPYPDKTQYIILGSTHRVSKNRPMVECIKHLLWCIFFLSLFESGRDNNLILLILFNKKRVYVVIELALTSSPL